jgi:hypothetical protein
MGVAVTTDVGLANEIGEIRASIARAQERIWANDTSAALGEAARELTQARHELDALDMEVVSALDASKEWTVEGHRSVAAYLTHRCKERPATAKRRARLARELRSMPHAADALRRGEISLDRVEALARVRVPTLADEFARDEAMLVDQARGLHHHDLLRALRYWSDINAPDDAEGRARKDFEECSLNLSTTWRGTGRLDADLTPFANRVVGDVLESIEHELWEADWAEARERLGEAATEADLRRTPTQRRHDALVEMAKRAKAAKAGVEPDWQINLIADLPTFIAALERLVAAVGDGDPDDIPYPDERETELDNGAVLTPMQVVALALLGRLQVIVTDERRVPIFLGRSQRFFTGPLRKVLMLIFKRCTHPFGCDVPARFCEIDHLLAYIDGGTTDPGNAGPKCTGHNLWKENERK